LQSFHFSFCFVSEPVTFVHINLKNFKWLQ
jgi:hypothetical protein